MKTKHSIEIEYNDECSGYWPVTVTLDNDKEFSGRTLKSVLKQVMDAILEEEN